MDVKQKWKLSTFFCARLCPEHRSRNQTESIFKELSVMGQWGQEDKQWDWD